MLLAPPPVLAEITSRDGRCVTNDAVMSAAPTSDADEGETKPRPSLFVPDTPFIFHPDSVISTRWSLLVSIATLLDCIFTPFTIAWRIEDEVYNGCMLIFDFIFVLHVVVTLRTALWESMELITDGCVIATRYAKLWLWIDLLPCLPFVSLAHFVCLVST